MQHHNAAIRAALAAKGLPPTARHALLVLAALTEYPLRPQQLPVSELSGLMGVPRLNATRAVEQCARAGHKVTVKKGGGRGVKTVICFGQIVDQPALFEGETVTKTPPFTPLFSEKGCSSLKALKEKHAHAGDTPRQAPSAPVHERHPEGCACAGTGWVNVSADPRKEALVRCSAEAWRRAGIAHLDQLIENAEKGLRPTLKVVR